MKPLGLASQLVEGKTGQVYGCVDGRERVGEGRDIGAAPSELILVPLQVAGVDGLSEQSRKKRPSDRA